MDHPRPVLRRPDGSIATEHHADRARDLRARASRAALLGAFRAAAAFAARARTGALSLMALRTGPLVRLVGGRPRAR